MVSTGNKWKIMKTTVSLILLLTTLLLTGCGKTNQSKTKENNTMENINKALTVGDKIPTVLGVNEKGEEVKASDFAGKKLVLYFYPKDSTPGCTAQACSLRDSYQSLLAKGYAILGVSVDSAVSHQKFIEKYNLPFSLIADTDKKLVEAFGVWVEKGTPDKPRKGTLRTTFIVNEEGIIEEVILPGEVKTKEHGDQILNR